MDVVSCRKRVGVEEMVGDPPTPHAFQAEDYQAVPPDVGQVGVDVDAVAISDVHGDVRVEAVLFDEVVRQGVAEEEFVGGQVEEEDLRGAHLEGFDGDVDLAGVQDPQTATAVGFDAENGGQALTRL